MQNNMEPHVPSPKQFFTQRNLLIVPNHRGEQNVLFDFSVNIQSSAVIAPKSSAHHNNQISALSRKDKGHNVVLQIKYLEIRYDKMRYTGTVLTVSKYLTYSEDLFGFSANVQP